MRTHQHPLVSDTPGTERQIISHHFGAGDARRTGPKVYIQAGLHAGEIPGMLVARHLVPLLEAIEAAGRMIGEVVLVPVANPIGLAQGFLQENIGRFEFHSSENFNRHYPDLAELMGNRLDGQLGADAGQNTTLIRAALAQTLAELPAKTELAALRKTLLAMALDADMVLDLHCDLEAVCHLYTTDNSREWGAHLSSYIDARVVLLSPMSGGHAFDEACSTPWDLLRKRYGDHFPVPAGCHATTVELRGLADVNDRMAGVDAANIADWLVSVGVVAPPAAGVQQAPVFVAGDLVPLAGTDDMVAPFGGIVSFRREVGERVQPGDVIADLIDPLTGQRVEIATRNDGLLYAREHRRFVRRNTSVAQVSGAVPIRSGPLLCAR